MPVITWEQTEARCGDDDNISVTIRELTDGVPTVIRILDDGTKIYKEYSSDRFYKDVPVDRFKASLKAKILADRDKSTKEGVFAEKLDLSDFEGYLNQ